jgi:phosphatidylglycerol:prolipoprotein diacylglycerol transferase
MGELLEHVHAGASSARWLPAWGALQIAAMLAAFAWFVKRTPGDLARLRVCLAAGFIGAAVGAAAFGMAIRVPAYVESGFELRALLRGGIMAYGALAGLAVTFAAMARRAGFHAGASLDRLAPSFGILVLLARVGCFFGGCEFGVVTSAPVGVRFPPQSPAFRQHLEAGRILASDRGSLAVHPTQLYEAASGILMIAVAIFIERKVRNTKNTKTPAAPGNVFAATAATYALCRFFIELARGDALRGHLGPLSTGQWLSLLVLAGAGAFFYARARPSGDHLQQRKPVE